jgi:hypothetical protein
MIINTKSNSFLLLFVEMSGLPTVILWGGIQNNQPFLFALLTVQSFSFLHSLKGRDWLVAK